MVVIAGVLEAQLDDVDAAAQRLLQERVGLRAADEIQARGMEGVANVGHARSLPGPSPAHDPPLGSTPYGSPTVGLRGRTPIRRPSRPDRVMPAQGGPLSEHPVTADVVIIGGGVIGLSVAWRARAARPACRRART